MMLGIWDARISEQWKPGRVPASIQLRYRNYPLRNSPVEFRRWLWKFRTQRKNHRAYEVWSYVERKA